MSLPGASLSKRKHPEPVPDVHVSMALVYEKLGLKRTACSHWKRYLQLKPDGSWAHVARKRLA